MLRCLEPEPLLEDISSAHPGLWELMEEGDCPKLEWACNRARRLANEGRKTLIWSSFVNNVEVISERLHDLGRFTSMVGSMGPEDEEDSREWKDQRVQEQPQLQGPVANPVAAGEGISLHKVCRMRYVDRTFNAAHYLQSVDRIQARPRRARDRSSRYWCREFHTSGRLE